MPGLYNVYQLCSTNDNICGGDFHILQGKDSFELNQVKFIDPQPVYQKFLSPGSLSTTQIFATSALIVAYMWNITSVFLHFLKL